jgi:hypothetical protein
MTVVAELQRQYWKMFEIVKKQGGDPEVEHGDADEILCEVLTLLGQKELVDLYKQIHKWYA